MTTCASCGADVDSGRFCTSCGLPLVRPEAKLPPPAPADLPPAPRFRMYADESVPTVQPPPPPPPPAPTPHRRRAAPWLAWVAVGVALVLVAGLGGWLLTRSGADGDTTATDTPTAEPTTEKPSGSATPESPEPGVAVPDTAPPNQDVNGNPVEYDGENMLDGNPSTCWRMPGDGTGEEITVTLAEESRLRSVGIVNGYAKVSDVDWYHGNRRVLQVEWAFDDGTTLVQSLDDTTEMQTVDVDVTTTTVVVRLLQVSPPGKGKTGRNFTAISELSLVGR